MAPPLCAQADGMAVASPHRQLDLGLCFQELYLIPVLCAIIVLGTAWRLIALAHAPPSSDSPLPLPGSSPPSSGAEKVSSAALLPAEPPSAADTAEDVDPNLAPSQLPPSAALSVPALIVKLLALVALAAVTIVKMTYFGSSDQSAATGAADLLASSGLLAVILAMAAIHAADYRAVMRSPSSLVVRPLRALTYTLLLVVSVVRLRSILTVDPDLASSTVGALNFAQLALLFVALVAELRAVSWSHHPWESILEKGLQTSPEYAANIYNRLLFIWTLPIFRLGSTRKIGPTDLWLLPPSLTTEVTRTKLLAVMYPKGRKPAPGEKSRTLMVSLWRWFGLDFAGAMLIELIAVGSDFVGPTIIGLIVQFVQEASRARASPSSGTAPTTAYGVALAFAFLGVNLLSILLRSQVFHRLMTMNIKSRSAMRGLLFDKLMSLPVHAQAENAGRIVNLVAVDTMNVGQMWFRLYTIPIVPIQVIVSTTLLYQQIGSSVFAALAVVVVFSPLFGLTAKLAMRYQKKKLGFMDTRIKQTTEVLQAIRTVKLNAWNAIFLDRIGRVREDELGELRKSSILSALNASLTIFVPSLASFTALLVATLTGTELRVSQLFVCLALFQLLQNSISNLSNVIQPFMNVLASYQRIRAFLAGDEHVSYVERLPAPPAPVPSATAGSAPLPLAQQPPVIEVRNAELAWKAADPATLHIGDLVVRRGERVVITGMVGSGKTQLLTALVDQLHLVNDGSVRVHGSFALVSQEPWLLNGTLRDNVLFGLPFDEQRYARVLHACALLPDLRQLPDEDMSLIGDRGVICSGGQQARIALARAIYADRDSYLLDDIMAALDSNTTRHIMEHAIDGMLAGKTVVAVTHQVNYWRWYDTRIEMKAGAIDQVVPDTGKLAAAVSLNEEETAASDDSSVTLDATTAAAAAASSGNSAAADVPTIRAMMEARKTKAAATTADERMVTGSVGIDVYAEYLRYCGWWGVALQALLIVAYQASNLGQQYWIGFWSVAPDAIDNIGYYFGIYGGLVVLFALLVIANNLNANAVLAIRASRKMSHDLLARMLAFPMSFYDVTPLGRAVNRLSSDQASVDSDIPSLLTAVVGASASVLFVFIAVAVSSPWFLLLVGPLTYLLWRVANYYVVTSRQVQRLIAVTRSPIYSILGEAATGRGTILAMGARPIFRHWLEGRLDLANRVFYCNISISRWLSATLQLIGSMIVFSCVMLAVTLPQNAVLVGVSITLAQNVTGQLMMLVRTYIWLESSIVCVERIKEYDSLPVENDGDQKFEVKRGEITFDGFSARYTARKDAEAAAQAKSDRAGRKAAAKAEAKAAAAAAAAAASAEKSGDEAEEMPLVLNNINLTIAPGSSVCIVGRTGSGKSSAAACLFRLLEAAEGRILVDGQDISRARLSDLRSQLTMIAQTPHLFEGTLRMALSPAGNHSDADLWRILDAVSPALAAEFRAHPDKLDLPVASASLSVGQRQLVCMARALLRDSLVYVLDEMSSSVDLASEAAMMACLEDPALMGGRTRIVIAHRIHTVLSTADRVLYLDAGHVVEDGSPAELIAREGSRFRQLVEDAGLLDDVLSGRLAIGSGAAAAAVDTSKE
ncbi:hypothetical protein H9P43_005806 [Blastocladiella emersonii ATCC 22665]|nr:hypothetical protein H9P43_005806 [Blastocladiella emersonii ATCC 22665]